MDPRARGEGTLRSTDRRIDGSRQEGQLMPPWRPVRRRELVASLRRLGFAGPYAGGKHEFMIAPIGQDCARVIGPGSDRCHAL